MAMRFRGGGVGHKSTRKATDSFLTDRHRLEIHAAMDNAEAESNSDEDSCDEEGSSNEEEHPNDDEWPTINIDDQNMEEGGYVENDSRDE